MSKKITQETLQEIATTLAHKDSNVGLGCYAKAALFVIRRELDVCKSKRRKPYITILDTARSLLANTDGETCSAAYDMLDDVIKNTPKRRRRKRVKFTKRL